jgi:hypothetical protein
MLTDGAIGWRRAAGERKTGKALQIRTHGGELGDQSSAEPGYFVLFEPRSCLSGPVSVHFTPF